MVNTMKQNFILDAGLPLKKDKLLSEKKDKNVCIKHFEVKEPESKKYKTKEGDYYTITFDDSVLYKNTNVIKKYFSKKRKGEPSSPPAPIDHSLEREPGVLYVVSPDRDG